MCASNSKKKAINVWATLHKNVNVKDDAMRAPFSRKFRYKNTVAETGVGGAVYKGCTRDAGSEAAPEALQSHQMDP